MGVGSHSWSPALAAAPALLFPSPLPYSLSPDWAPSVCGELEARMASMASGIEDLVRLSNLKIQDPEV